MSQFQKANLSQSNFHKANLSGNNLQGVDCQIGISTVFSDTFSLSFYARS
ncbi:pentapeptide repeat-containing protein [Roseofilum acuticapitatum]